MATEEAASEAIKSFDGDLLNDRALAVSEARPREERFSGSSSIRKGKWQPFVT